MTNDFCVPQIVAAKNTVSAETVALWKKAVWTVRLGQKRFLEAYQATLVDFCPDWKSKWKTDGNFHNLIKDAEDTMKLLCGQNGMGLTTFNRYRNAARKSLFIGVDFKLAAQNFTISEIKAIAESGEEVAKSLRKEKQVRHAAQVLSPHATVLPFPDEKEHPEDYLNSVKTKLTEYIAIIRATFGEEEVAKLIDEITK